MEVNPQPAAGDGPLHGIPFGVKDTYETKGLSTAYGSPLYAGRKGEYDAALVKMLRDLGGIMVGKTHTTSFAYFDPAPTRNPKAPGRTPGGSSAGSAAAVAAGMVPFALGSQTQGSVLRPASYCGVAGLKPTRGVLPVEGILPLAPSLDTPGLFTPTAREMKDLWGRMYGPQPGTVGRRLGWIAVACEPPMEAAVQATVEQVCAAGFSVEHLDDWPAIVDATWEAVRTINFYEGARTFEERWRQHGQMIGVKLAELVERGLAMPAEQYAEAKENLETTRRRLEKVLDTVDAILSPAAPGYAPVGYATTGDPRMNGPWTGLETPAISVPMGGGEFPLGLQIVAAWHQERDLLETAAAIETVIS